MPKLIRVLFIFFSIGIACQAQDVLPLFSSKVEVKYAMFSPNGNYFLVATAGDSIVVKDAATLLSRKIINAFTSTSVMSDTYTGRKIFHLTKDNQILYVLKKMNNNIVDLVLRSEGLETGTTNYEIPLTSIKREDLDSEKLYNRLIYGLSVSGNTLLCFLNESVISVDMASGKITNRWSEDHSKYAALNSSQKYLSIATSDSIKVLEANSGRRVWGLRITVNGLQFLGDSLLTFGDDVILFDATSAKVIQKLYHAPGSIYGMEMSQDERHLTFSNSYFSEKGFTATYNNPDLSLNSVFHLPKTDGYVSLFHPLTNQHWLVTTRGYLYRFSYNDQPIPPSNGTSQNDSIFFLFHRSPQPFDSKR